MKTKEEKLKEIIEYGVERGWDGWKSYTPAFISGDKKRKEKVLNTIMMSRKEAILFSHSFAKAFWKDEEFVIKNNPLGKPWQYHLQQAVISDDPVDYYYKYIKETL